MVAGRLLAVSGFVVAGILEVGGSEKNGGPTDEEQINKVIAGVTSAKGDKSGKALAALKRLAKQVTLANSFITTVKKEVVASSRRRRDDFSESSDGGDDDRDEREGDEELNQGDEDQELSQDEEGLEAEIAEEADRESPVRAFLDQDGGNNESVLDLLRRASAGPLAQLDLSSSSGSNDVVENGHDDLGNGQALKQDDGSERHGESLERHASGGVSPQLPVSEEEDDGVLVDLNEVKKLEAREYLVAQIANGLIDGSLDLENFLKVSPNIRDLVPDVESTLRSLATQVESVRQLEEVRVGESLRKTHQLLMNILSRLDEERSTKERFQRDKEVPEGPGAALRVASLMGPEDSLTTGSSLNPIGTALNPIDSSMSPVDLTSMRSEVRKAKERETVVVTMVNGLLGGSLDLTEFLLANPEARELLPQVQRRLRSLEAHVRQVHQMDEQVDQMDEQMDQMDEQMVANSIRQTHQLLVNMQAILDSQRVRNSGGAPENSEHAESVVSENALLANRGTATPLATSTPDSSDEESGVEDLVNQLLSGSLSIETFRATNPRASQLLPEIESQIRTLESRVRQVQQLETDREVVVSAMKSTSGLLFQIQSILDQERAAKKKQVDEQKKLLELSTTNVQDLGALSGQVAAVVIDDVLDQVERLTSVPAGKSAEPLVPVSVEELERLHEVMKAMSSLSAWGDVMANVEESEFLSRRVTNAERQRKSRIERIKMRLILWGDADDGSSFNEEGDLFDDLVSACSSLLATYWDELPAPSQLLVQHVLLEYSLTQFAMEVERRGRDASQGARNTSSGPRKRRDSDLESSSTQSLTQDLLDKMFEDSSDGENSSQGASENDFSQSGSSDYSQSGSSDFGLLDPVDGNMSRLHLTESEAIDLLETFLREGFAPEARMYMESRVAEFRLSEMDGDFIDQLLGPAESAKNAFDAVSTEPEAMQLVLGDLEILKEMVKRVSIVIGIDVEASEEEEEEEADEPVVGGKSKTSDSRSVSGSSSDGSRSVSDTDSAFEIAGRRDGSSGLDHLAVINAIARIREWDDAESDAEPFNDEGISNRELVVACNDLYSEWSVLNPKTRDLIESVLVADIMTKFNPDPDASVVDSDDEYGREYQDAEGEADEAENEVEGTQDEGSEGELFDPERMDKEVVDEDDEVVAEDLDGADGAEVASLPESTRSGSSKSNSGSSKTKSVDDNPLSKSTLFQMGPGAGFFTAPSGSILAHKSAVVNRADPDLAYLNVPEDRLVFLFKEFLANGVAPQAAEYMKWRVAAFEAREMSEESGGNDQEGDEVEEGDEIEEEEEDQANEEGNDSEDNRSTDTLERLRPFPNNAAFSDFVEYHGSPVGFNPDDLGFQDNLNVLVMSGDVSKGVILESVEEENKEADEEGEEADPIEEADPSDEDDDDDGSKTSVQSDAVQRLKDELVEWGLANSNEEADFDWGEATDAQVVRACSELFDSHLLWKAGTTGFSDMQAGLGPATVRQLQLVLMDHTIQQHFSDAKLGEVEVGKGEAAGEEDKGEAAGEEDKGEAAGEEDKDEADAESDADQDPLAKALNRLEMSEAQITDHMTSLVAANAIPRATEYMKNRIAARKVRVEMDILRFVLDKKTKALDATAKEIRAALKDKSFAQTLQSHSLTRLLTRAAVLEWDGFGPLQALPGATEKSMRAAVYAIATSNIDLMRPRALNYHLATLIPLAQKPGTLDRFWTSLLLQKLEDVKVLETVHGLEAEFVAGIVETSMAYWTSVDSAKSSIRKTFLNTSSEKSTTDSSRSAGSSSSQKQALPKFSSGVSKVHILVACDELLKEYDDADYEDLPIEFRNYIEANGTQEDV